MAHIFKLVHVHVRAFPQVSGCVTRHRGGQQAQCLAMFRSTSLAASRVACSLSASRRKRSIGMDLVSTCHTQYPFGPGCLFLVCFETQEVRRDLVLAACSLSAWRRKTGIGVPSILAMILDEAADLLILVQFVHRISLPSSSHIGCCQAGLGDEGRNRLQSESSEDSDGDDHDRLQEGNEETEAEDVEVSTASLVLSVDPLGAFIAQTFGKVMAVISESTRGTEIFTCG